MGWENRCDVSALVGKTLVSITGVDEDDVWLTTTDGERFHMYHQQDCCEGVFIDSVIGNLSDVIGSPITEASHDTSNENPEGVDKEYQDSFTWTYIRLATASGEVTLRWYGESNGYYSESVDVERYDESVSFGRG